MCKKFRGNALIINIKNTDNCPERVGTDVDCSHLTQLFTKLGFNVLVYNDKDGLTAEVSKNDS